MGRDAGGRFTSGGGAPKVGFEIRGVAEVKKAIARAAALYPTAVGQAQQIEAYEIVAESQEIVPVKYGVLRASAYVAPPESTKNGVSVELGFGASYALVVHEMTEVFHHVGQAKYLEVVVHEHLDGYLERTADRVRAIVRGRGAGGDFADLMR